jgi:hypothetical protein
MANTTTMRNRNEERPFGTAPYGTQTQDTDGGTITEKARDLASAAGDKARDAAVGIADKARDLAAAAGDKARDTAVGIADKARDLASAVGDKARESVTSVAAGVGQKASDIASQVGHKADDVKSAVGSTMKSLAGSIREQTSEGGPLQTASKNVADSLESGGRYLEEEGLSRIGSDAMNFVRRNPLPALCAGIAFGYLVAKLTTSRS